MTESVRVLIASPLEPALVARIEAVDPRVAVLYEPALLPEPRYAADHTGVPRALSEADLRRWAELRRQADVSFDFDWQDPAQMPVNCPRLRWVQGTSAGLGGFLARTGLDASGLTFTTAAGVHGTPLAEYVLLGLLYFAKRMPELTAWQAERRWELHESGQLAGRRVLLVGLGGIGRQVAALLSAAGVVVCGAGRGGRHYDVPGVTSYVPSDRLDEALPEVDAVVLACPLTEQTRGLIGRRQFGLMRPGAVLINVSRGAVVDEDAMIDALGGGQLGGGQLGGGQLGGGQLGGAFLDVFTEEPLPAGSPLWELPNVVISPHSASTVDTENELICELFCENLRRWLAARPLRNVYDRAAGY